MSFALVGLLHWHADRDDGILFHRFNPPALEVCIDSLEPGDGQAIDLLRTTNVDEAVALSISAGARWLTVYISPCTDPLTPDVVRLRVDRETPPGDKLAITRHGLFSDGTVAFAEVDIFPLPASDDVVTIAHELMHAQGVDHVCTLADQVRAKGDPPYCTEEDTGNLLFPARNWSGAGIGGLRERVDRVYREM